MKLIAILALPLFFTACTDSTPPAEIPAYPVQPKPHVVKQPKPVVVKTTTPQGKLTGIDIGTLFTMSQSGKAYMIDVRPPLYYRLGHIDGAASMPLIKYDKIIAANRPLLDAAIKSGKVIVLYCQNTNCPDAHKTGLKLIKLGYSVSVYRGGWEEWKHAGF